MYSQDSSRFLVVLGASMEEGEEEEEEEKEEEIEVMLLVPVLTTRT